MAVECWANCVWNQWVVVSHDDDFDGKTTESIAAKLIHFKHSLLNTLWSYQTWNLNSRKKGGWLIFGKVRNSNSKKKKKKKKHKHDVRIVVSMTVAGVYLSPEIRLTVWSSLTFSWSHLHCNQNQTFSVAIMAAQSLRLQMCVQG